MSLDSEKMAELKANALAEMGESDETDDAPAPEPKAEVVEEVEVEEPEAKAEDEKPAESEKKDEKPEPEEEAKADTEEEPDEIEIDGDAEDYLPPADYKAPVEEEEPEVKPTVDTETAERLAALEAENEWIKTQAAKNGVNLERPTLELTDEQLQELEDTSPEMAKFAVAAIEQIKALSAKLTEAPKPDPKEQEEAERKQATERTRKAIAAVPELDYWFNYEERTGKAMPKAIEKAQQIVIDEEAKLQTDPAYSTDQVKRFKEATRRAVERINEATTARAVSRKSPSLAAAPGSAPEGGLVERIKAMPPTAMLKAINDLPEDQQRIVKRAIYS